MQNAQAFAGDRGLWNDWSFSFRSDVLATHGRMKLLMERAQACDVPLAQPMDPQGRQLGERLYFVLVMPVCDMALKKVRAAPEGRGTEIRRVLCDEYEPTRARLFQALLSSIWRASLKDPLGFALDDFERQFRLDDDQSGRKIAEDVVVATLTAGIENAAVS